MMVPAAVKLLQIQLNRPEDFKAFLNEARTIRLRHPHIVPLLDFGLSREDQPFLVMEYAAGGTLRDSHAKGSCLPQPTIVSYVQQVASALQYAHEHRVIHRDVKPENMLVRADGSLLLSDFGIATVAHSSHSINLQQGIGGTLPYMAPEQIQGQPRPASDQYALAIVVYEWIAGQRPFEGTTVEIAMQHAMTAPPSLLELVPTLSRDVEQIVLKALAKEPKERFASIEQFAQALQAAIQSPPAPALQNIPIAPALPSIAPTPSTPIPVSQNPAVQPTLAGMPVDTVLPSEQSQQRSRITNTPLPQSGTVQLISTSAQADLAETLTASGKPTRSPLTPPSISSTRAVWTSQPPSASPAQSEAASRSTLARGTHKRGFSRRAVQMGILAALVLLLSGTGLWNVGTHLQIQHNQQATATAHVHASPAGATQAYPVGSITEFPLPTANSYSDGITTGPDGNLWFTEVLVNQQHTIIIGSKIGRISPSGSITEFPLPTANSYSDGITTGPDGNLWFTEVLVNQQHTIIGSKIGRISPSGSITEFPLPTANSYPDGITSGPDGNLWFTKWVGGKIGRISPSGTITEFPVPTASSQPVGIAAGPDGNLWFTEWVGGKIGRISPSGSITEFPLPTANSYPDGITTGPDGNLWFTEYSGNKIGRISPSGSITEFPLPTANSFPDGITTGPDGNLWFIEADGNNIGRISPSGSITEFPVPTANSFPGEITAGPDGNLWFTENRGNIGRITSGK